MVTGLGTESWYTTVAPSEHFDSGRSQVFSAACNLSQLSGAANPLRMTTRTAPASYPYIYNVATRNSDELFIYGGSDGVANPYVAKLDPASLTEVWRATLPLATSQWKFIGAMGVHANGYVYSVQSNVLARIDPLSGSVQKVNLPQLAAPTGTGAAYNGFVVTPDGLIVAKSMERGYCSDGTEAINCVVTNGLPSTLVVVHPDTLSVLASIQTSEPVLGRIMTEQHDGIDYIYLPGVSKLVRYRYTKGNLSLDTRWGPVGYGQGRNASGVGLLGNYAVLQTNYTYSATPSYVVAANIYNGSEQYAIQPFLGSGTLSWVPDKAALDGENNRIYAEDTYARQVAALSVGSGGLTVLWKVTDQATGFPALIGPASARQLVVPYYVNGGDTLAWRDTATGALVAQSGKLAAQATIGASAPGFAGRMYYPSYASGKLIEVTPQTAP